MFDFYMNYSLYDIVKVLGVKISTKTKNLVLVKENSINNILQKEHHHQHAILDSVD